MPAFLTIARGVFQYRICQIVKAGNPQPITEQIAKSPIPAMFEKVAVPDATCFIPTETMMDEIIARAMATGMSKQHMTIVKRHENGRLKMIGSGKGAFIRST